MGRLFEATFGVDQTTVGAYPDGAIMIKQGNNIVTVDERELDLIIALREAAKKLNASKATKITGFEASGV